jgi:hypothetical protein
METLRNDQSSPLHEAANNGKKHRSGARDEKGANQLTKDPRPPHNQSHVVDENLTSVPKDPRGDDPSKRIAKKKRGGRNTESFDPKSTLVRPDLRVKIGSPALKSYPKTLKHDDVVIVPELFGPEDDWELYYQLAEKWWTCRTRTSRAVNGFPGTKERI